MRCVDCIDGIPSRCGGMRHSIPLPASISWKANTLDNSVAIREDNRVDRRLETVIMAFDITTPG